MPQSVEDILNQFDPVAPAASVQPAASATKPRPNFTFTSSTAPQPNADDINAILDKFDPQPTTGINTQGGSALSPDEQTAYEARLNKLFPQPTGTPLPTFMQRLALSGLADDPNNRDSYDRLAEQLRQQEAKFQQENSTPDAPLNLSGVPQDTGLRFLLSDKDPQEQFDYLKKNGLNPQRTADYRHIMIQQQGDDGKPERVLLDPPYGFHPLSDLAANAVPAAETAAKFAAGGLVGAPEAALATRVGAALAPGAIDLEQGKPLSSAALDTALTAGPTVALAGAQKALGLARNAVVGAPNALTQVASDAAERQGVVFSPALATGSPTLAKAEVSLGAKKAVGDVNKQTLENSLQQSQNQFAVGDTGPRPLASQADLAAQAKPILAAQNATADAATNAKLADAARVAQLRANALGTGLTNTDVGSAVRNAVVGPNGVAEAARAVDKANYGALNDLAATEGITVPTQPYTDLKNAVDAKTTDALLELNPAIKKIPRIEQLLTGAPEEGATSGLLDQFGKPIPAVAEPPPPLTIQQNREIKNAAYDMLNSGAAPGEGNPGNRYLTMLYKTAQAAEKQAIASGSDTLQKLATTADAAHVANIVPLQQSDVAKLFLDTDAAGRLGDDEIVKRLFTGTGNLDALRAYKNVLRTNPSAYEALVAQGRQHMIDTAAGDGGAFLNKINALDPEVQNEVFGATLPTVKANATLQKAVQGGNVADADIAAALKQVDPAVATKAKAALDAQQAYQQNYQTSLLKSLRDGTLDPASLNLDHFVSNFVNNASAANTAKVLSALPPDLQQRIAFRTITDIVDSARDADSISGVPSFLNPDKLESYLKGQDAAKYQAAIAPLGPQASEFLQDMVPIMKQIKALDLAQAVGGTNLRKVISYGLGGATLTGALANELGASGLSGAGLGSLLGISHELAPPVLQSILGNAQRLAAVRDFLTTGQLPSFLTNAAQLAPVAIQGARTLATQQANQQPFPPTVPLATQR